MFRRNTRRQQVYLLRVPRTPKVHQSANTPFKFKISNESLTVL